VENITHAFFHCPAVTPVITWLIQAWQHLVTEYELAKTSTGPQGQAAPQPTPAHAIVPRTVAVILLDDLAAWPDHPRDQRLLKMWTRLRVTTLGAIWQTRAARAERRDERPFAGRAINLTIHTLCEAIKRDWARTQQDMRMLDDGSFCSAWWRGFDARLTPEKFEEQWPPVFHKIRNQAPDQTIDLLLTTSHLPF
jgi:hypothetical protein